jgi:hypothetical protein
MSDLFWQVPLVAFAIAAAFVVLRGTWKDERVWFNFANYTPLRDRGLSHKEAIKELDRIWDAR